MKSSGDGALVVPPGTSAWRHTPIPRATIHSAIQISVRPCRVTILRPHLGRVARSPTGHLRARVIIDCKAAREQRRAPIVGPRMSPDAQAVAGALTGSSVGVRV